MTRIGHRPRTAPEARQKAARGARDRSTRQDAGALEGSHDNRPPDAGGDGSTQDRGAPLARRKGMSMCEIATHAVMMSSMTALLWRREEVAKWFLAPRLGPSDDRLRATAVAQPHSKPDCGPPSCLEGFLKDGRHAEAVSNLVDTALYQVHKDNQAYLGEATPVKVSYQQQKYFPNTAGNWVPARDTVVLSLDEIAQKSNHLSSGSPDESLQAVANHEMIHSVTHRAFSKAANEMGDKIVKADPYVRGSREVVVESLTTALENVPGVAGKGYATHRCGLVRDRWDRPVSWRQFGRHLVQHLGADTVKKAMFQADPASVKKIERYVDELIQSQPRKRLSG